MQDPEVPLSQIFRRLSKHQVYLKKRDLKFVDKELNNKEQLQAELAELNSKITAETGEEDISKIKKGLKLKIAQLK